MLDETNEGRLTLLWLVALGLLNSVVSAFYYVRVLRAMFLRPSTGAALGPAPTSVAVTIIVATAVSLGFGIFPEPLLDAMKSASVPMLTANGSRSSGSMIFRTQPKSAPTSVAPPSTPPAAPAVDSKKSSR